MSFKKRLLSGLLAVTMIVVTGCSSSGGKDGKVELRYAIWDKTHVPAIESLITEYETANPDVDIKLEQYTFADYWTKMETAAAGGSAPDIYWMNAVNFNKYADNGMLVSMDDMIKEKNVDMTQYLDSLTKLYNYKGEQYGMPSFWDNNILLINTSLMEQYNIPEPKENWNWDEMISWLEDAKSKLPNDVYPFASYATESTQSGVFNEVASAGGKVISDDKTKALLNTPETKDGFKKYYDLASSDLHAPLDVSLEVGGSTLFKSEKALVLQTGSYGLLPYSDEEQSQVAGKFKIYTIPTIKEGNTSKSVIHGLGNVVSTNSKNPEEAFDFINYMSSEESMKKYTESALVPQSHKNVQDLFGKVMKEKTGLDTAIMSELAKDAMPLPNSFETSKWDKAIMDNMSKFMQGEIDLDTALENAQNEMQTILDKENK
ncbi:MAG: ABC transporter substrate-binding protein [Romboutsia sp.]|uniref:ABC transporter substrate-binding protein n=1 Tax=Romboutsia sp. TaxID=1965302 RepID=UPI003F3F6105